MRAPQHHPGGADLPMILARSGALSSALTIPPWTANLAGVELLEPGTPGPPRPSQGVPGCPTILPDQEGRLPRLCILRSTSHLSSPSGLPGWRSPVNADASGGSCGVVQVRCGPTMATHHLASIPDVLGTKNDTSGIQVRHRNRRRLRPDVVTLLEPGGRREARDRQSSAQMESGVSLLTDGQD